MFRKLCFTTVLFCFAFMLGVQPIYAISHNYVLDTPYVEIGQNQTLGTLVIQEDKNTNTFIKPGNIIEITLPKGVTYAKTPSIGMVVYDENYAQKHNLKSTANEYVSFVDNQSVKDDVYFEIIDSGTDFMFLQMNSINNTSYIRKDKSVENELYFKFNVNITNQVSDKIKIEIHSTGVFLTDEFVTVAEFKDNNTSNNSSSYNINTTEKNQEDITTLQNNTTTIETKFSIGNNTMYINGKSKPLNIAPEIKNGHTLVPLRALSEALGSNVKWEPKTKTITVIKQ